MFLILARPTKPLLSIAFLFGTIVAGSAVARADLLTTTTELLFEEQGTSAIVLGSTFGADPRSPLSFTSFIDPSGSSFSYATISGSTYLGQSLTISGSGMLDAGNYDVSASINLGGAILQILGKETVKENPDGSVTITSDKDKIEDGKKTGDTHTETRLTGLGGDDPKSHADGHLTEPDGTTTPDSDFSADDTWNKKTKKWEWDGHFDVMGGPVPDVFSSGFTPAEGGAGTFTTIITAPEPSTLKLFLPGLLILLVCLRAPLRRPR